MRMNRSKYLTMKELPEGEKPYEKCERFGPQVLTDAELLAVILRTGAKGISAVDLSRGILGAAQGHSLAGLCRISVKDLRALRGIGRVKALQVLCIGELSRRIAQSRIVEDDAVDFSCPDSVGAYYMEEMRHRTQESVLVLCLNSKGRLIREEYISTGTADMALLSPREVFLCALSNGAVSVIVLHNHPSGDPTPSEADIRSTSLIRRSGEMIGIPLADHIIIGDRCMVSMREQGLI